MKQLRAVLAAFALLTVLPVGGLGGGTAPAVWSFPLVGAVVGALLFAVDAAARTAVPAGAASWVVLVAWVAVTGAIHLDGLADSADGLLGHGTPARRLQVMADPRAGAFGVAAVVLLLLGKWSLLANLEGTPRSLTLLLAPVVARGALPIALELARPAREEGMAWALDRSTGRRGRWFALLLTLAGALAAVPVAPFLFVGAGAAAALLALWARRSVGGVTGDILGGAVELGELVVLFVAVAAAEEGWW